jgi:phosphoserine aminotransferase
MSSQVGSRVFNFSAGPAALPTPVLEQAQKDLLCLPGAGASILEISHRSPAFIDILTAAKQDLTDLLGIPENYKVLFVQGGSRLQFSMVPMNLLRGQEKPADYVVTGSWSSKALTEAGREGPTHVAYSSKASNFDRLPEANELQLSTDAAYTYFTSNETIQGVQFDADPDWSEVPLVCDASSDFLHRPIDVSRYGLIYACAQKNAGPAGVTVVIIREDLLERSQQPSQENLAGYLNYSEHVQNNSLYNTPPTFAIYVLGLVAKWIRNDVGGLDQMLVRNREKASLLYDIIDGSDGFYEGHAQPSCRSLMNVTFRLPTDELSASFLEQAKAEGLHSLAGHRSVGGVRASIYNAMSQEGVAKLAGFMRAFHDAQKHESQCSESTDCES